METPQELKEIFQRYLINQCTAEEVEMLMQHFHTENKGFLETLVSEELEKPEQDEAGLNVKPSLEKVYNRIHLEIQKGRKGIQKPLWPRIAAAASIILLLSFGGYFILHKRPTQQIAQNQIHDIAPGGNKAILTLTNGQRISLTDARNGTVASQGQTLIKKTANGEVVYNAENTTSENAGKEQYNTITTPRGGQYRLKLSDGTIAMLDAASSIRYPVNFTGDERKVEITGQVYFEVVHNAAKPFRVEVKGETIEDIGTSFNVNAYNDEPDVSTTLVEGSVKVMENGHQALLKPGQQAITRAGQRSIIIKSANLDAALAWKNGYFKFEDEDLKSIMREVSRWYNVDVDYQGNAGDNVALLGEVSRFKNISAVLKIMQATGEVHFQVSGRRVTVMP